MLKQKEIKIVWALLVFLVNNTHLYIHTKCLEGVMTDHRRMKVYQK